MILFLVHTIDAFLPLALCLGLLAALLQAPGRPRRLAPLLRATLFGLIAGWALYSLAAGQQQFTLFRTVLRGALLLAAPAALWGALLARHRRAAFRAAAMPAAASFAAALAAQGVFALRDRIYNAGLSATSVINTELILNLAGLLTGLLLLALLTPLTRRMALVAGRRAAGALLALAVGGLCLPWGAEALLGLMRLQAVELTSARLSFVARVTDFASKRGYLLLALVAVLAALFLYRALAAFRVRAAPEQPAARRKERSLRLGALQQFKLAAAVLTLLAGTFLYHDLYASSPPRISTPATVRPGADGMFHFHIADFADGRLHRFAYVMRNGKVVRFFLMNKLEGQIKIGVAFDACRMCGDRGYIQKGNNLICLACQVSIFVPSLGKEGGCNPIPLPHEVKGDEIIIAAADLEAGARYFNEVRDIEVRDPVTGETVINTKAPYQYEYGGETYFFGSEKSWELFREKPEKYLESASEGAVRPCCAAHGEG